jgi:hypothetical protein
MNETPIAQPFLADVTTLRERARQNIEKRAVTFTYQGDVNNTIEILQSVLATEIVCASLYHARNGCCWHFKRRRRWCCDALAFRLATWVEGARSAKPY